MQRFSPHSRSSRTLRHSAGLLLAGMFYLTILLPGLHPLLHERLHLEEQLQHRGHTHHGLQLDWQLFLRLRAAAHRTPPQAELAPAHPRHPCPLCSFLNTLQLTPPQVAQLAILLTPILFLATRLVHRRAYATLPLFDVRGPPLF